MKFPQVPLGQRFLFQGESYLKIGPLTARRERDGENRLIPRSALVSLHRPGDSGATVEPGTASAQCGRALDAYEQALRSSLLSVGEEGDRAFQARLDQALSLARRAFQEVLAETAEPSKGA
jgi:hypothetical protein